MRGMFEKMKGILASLVIVSLLIFSWIAHADDEEAKPSRPRKFITLTLGVEYDEKLPPMPSTISFKGDFKKVTRASYSKEANTIRFSPLAEGISTLTVHDKSGKVIAEYRLDVKKSKLDAIVREIQSLLGDIEGIQIKVINNKVVVDGQVLLPRDLSRIYSVVNQFGDQAASIVSLSPLAQKKIAEFISRDINNPEIEVRAVNEKFILQGVANSEEEKTRAEIIAKTYIPPVVINENDKELIKKPKPTNDGVINLITVKPAAAPPPGKMIQLVVHYVELKKDYSKGFRFQFTPELTDSTQVGFGTSSNAPGGVFSSITGTISNLLPKLNWAKSHGHARVLESSSLIVQDGRQGTLSSVQKVPYQVAVGPQGTPSTNFERVGIETVITPVILGERSDSINLDMQFKISSLLGKTDAGPLTSENNINTGIVVRSGQSAAVGGLITNNNFTDYNRMPSSVKNPIVSLYASKDFARNQSQFVVFVTPIIKSSASSGSEKIKKKFRLRD